MNKKTKVYFLTFLLFVIILSFVMVLTGHAQTPDTIPQYSITVTKTLLTKHRSITYYHANGTNDGQSITAVTAGGSGVVYNFKDADSVCRYIASCGFDCFQINYQLNSLTNVLFNTEDCLIRNAADIRYGINYIITHKAKFNNPTAMQKNLIGLSYGGGVMNYLAYHSTDINKVISDWGFVLDPNYIINVPTLCIAGTLDKTVPYDEGYFHSLVYLYGAKSIYDYGVENGFEFELLSFTNASHGLNQGTKTSENKRIANNATIEFFK